VEQTVVHDGVGFGLHEEVAEMLRYSEDFATFFNKGDVGIEDGVLTL
jgi:hypothetical protein